MPQNEPISAPWADPADAPELTEDLLQNVEIFDGEKFVRCAGRPRSAAPKERVSLRLDPDVLAKLRQAGPGWQSTVNAILRRALDLP